MNGLRELPSGNCRVPARIIADALIFSSEQRLRLRVWPVIMSRFEAYRSHQNDSKTHTHLTHTRVANQCKPYKVFPITTTLSSRAPS